MSKKLELTNAGHRLMLKSQGGTPIKFTRLIMGDGQLTTQNPQALTAVLHEVYSIPIETGKMVDDYFTTGGPFERSKVPTAFRWREFAIGALDPEQGEIVYAYAYDYDEGEYIDPAAAGVFVEEEIRVNIFVGAATVTCSYDGSLVWATQQDLRALQSAFDVKLAQKANAARVIRSRVRDPAKPTYGLEGGDENNDQATLHVSAYTGRAEVTAEVSGVLYDANNMSASGDTAPDGSLIIETMEE